MKIHNFKESLILGEQGEEIIVNHIKENKNTKSIIDVRNDKEYQKIDVDIVINHINNNSYYGEIKTDSYKSGNIFYETISAQEVNSLGCMDKTKADFLFYYFINMNKLYTLNMKKYNEWFNKNKSYFDKQGYRKALKNSRYNGSTYSSIGYAIPLILLEKEDWVKIENMPSI